MKPIDALSLTDQRRIRTLMAKDEAYGLTSGDTMEVIALVRKAAKLAKKRIPKDLREDMKRIEAEAEEMAEAA